MTGLRDPTNTSLQNAESTFMGEVASSVNMLAAGKPTVTVIMIVVAIALSGVTVAGLATARHKHHDPPANNPPPASHVVEIVLENAATATVLSSAPYQAYLAATYAQATHFYAACHYSYPDYAAMTSGRYFACGNASIPIQGVTNLADLIDQGNLTWAAYFESMSSPCQLASAGSYVSYHNPFILYKDIRYNTSRCDGHVVNSAAFNSSVANDSLPSFSYYVPNIYDDCYKSSMAFCDNWLKNFLSPILNSTSPAVQKLVASTVFLIVYDEGEESGSAFDSGYSADHSHVNTWCKNTTGTALSACGGLTYAVAVSPWSAKLHYDTNASDYDLQSTVEWILKLGSDGGWDGSSAFPAMTGLFK
ncbi:MAG TPA: alkaline phosphatase family protein [Thermoplasmata archaeon]|nr:alkaline phosphatase family protein [Thermoplasmata archaeon]